MFQPLIFRGVSPSKGEDITWGKSKKHLGEDITFGEESPKG